jgi:hypothetical protein
MKALNNGDLAPLLKIKNYRYMQYCNWKDLVKISKNLRQIGLISMKNFVSDF